MHAVARLGRAGVYAAFALALTGCCVLPFGAPRGARGHGGYYDNPSPQRGPGGPYAYPGERPRRGP